MKGTPIERFIAKVEWGPKFQGTHCLLWTASTNPQGYGRFFVAGRIWLPHRWLYERWVGPIPDGLELDHLCRRPACVNPMHMEPVTHLENVRRGLAGKVQGVRRVVTHCPLGHEYTEENTRIYRGGRYCRECNRIKARINRHKTMAGGN